MQKAHDLDRFFTDPIHSHERERSEHQFPHAFDAAGPPLVGEVS